MRWYIDGLASYVSATGALLLTLSTCPQVPQVARGLAERVLSNSASKLKKYLTEAVKLSGVSLDKYSKIVASICEGTFSALQHDQLVENEKEVSLLICLFTQPVLFLTRFFCRTASSFGRPVTLHALIPFSHYFNLQDSQGHLEKEAEVEAYSSSLKSALRNKFPEVDF